MTIDSLFHQVRDFHKVMEQPHPDEPTMQTPDLIERRMDWVDSEQDELREAKTVEDQADAYLDIIYFAFGGLVELGVMPHWLWRYAHEANMAKVWPDGTVRKRADGKIIKPPEWVDPTPLQRAAVQAQAQHRPLRVQRFDA
jgi:predicted HAD superfamily Cof-like phosphohydrolase